MGCQNSKLSGDLMAIPPKLRPLLWRKFEEMRRRRNVVPGTTLSNKQLLIDGCQEECSTFLASSVHESESRSIASAESVATSRSHEKTGKESDKKCEENEKSKSEGQEEKKTEALKDEDQEENEQNNVKNDEIEIDLKVVQAVAIEEVVVVKDEERAVEEKEDEERAMEEKEDEGKDEVREGEKIYPGSPSFRVYFIEALENDEDENESKTEEKDEDDKDDNGSEKKQHGEENVDNIIVVASNEEQEAKIIKKKGKRGMRITRALCRGGPVAVKHLFNVSSCYHPTNDRDSLLTRKTST
ncbi:hypothetical protein UlMin_007615 [Ulmus minor]